MKIIREGIKVTELEKFVSEQIKAIVPRYDMVELEAIVTKSGFGVEFFATVDGKRMQNYQMIDGGLISEKSFDKFAKAVADYVRALPEFNQDGLNKYRMVLKPEDEPQEKTQEEANEPAT